jgi:ABC-2 type transport system ATP-binding protein
MKQLLAKSDKETFFFDLVDPIIILPDLNCLSSQLIDPTTIEVEISGKDNISQVFDVLSNNNINVSSMRNKSNRLEELFLDLLNNNNKLG